MASYFDSTIRAQVLLEGLKSQEANNFMAFLRLIDADIVDRLSKAQSDLSRTKFESLLKTIRSSIGKIFDDYYDDLSGQLIDIADYQAEFEVKKLTRLFAPESLVFVAPTIEQLRAAIYSKPLSAQGVDGVLLDDLLKGMSKSETDRITNAIRSGYFEGLTNQQIIQKIRGTKKNNYSDGILAISNRNAESIVRTSIQHVASQARLAVLDNYDDVTNKIKIVATLDSRTSTICRSLDGRIFDKTKAKLPPYHIRCRTSFIPVLNEEYSFLSEGRTRASKDGQVDADLTYYEWLKKQPNAFQDKILGEDKAKLFRDGGLSASRFAEINLDRNFKPLSLGEMKKLEPLAFEKAGI